MRLGVVVDIGPDHIVLDGDPAPPWKGAQQPPPISQFRDACFTCVHIIRDPCLLWPNGWMDQDVTWYGGRAWSGNIVLDGDPPPHISANIYCG